MKAALSSFSFASSSSSFTCSTLVCPSSSVVQYPSSLPVSPVSPPVTLHILFPLLPPPPPFLFFLFVLFTHFSSIPPSPTFLPSLTPSLLLRSLSPESRMNNAVFCSDNHHHHPWCFLWYLFFHSQLVKHFFFFISFSLFSCLSERMTADKDNCAYVKAIIKCCNNICTVYFPYALLT